ncbi:MAG: hypothetical protein MUO77_14815, partial [Anaerolineales bacterium]|nr:hypothetical protein [Anaerolineales bacterium]
KDLMPREFPVTAIMIDKWRAVVLGQESLIVSPIIFIITAMSEKVKIKIWAVVVIGPLAFLGLAHYYPASYATNYPTSTGKNSCS